MELQLSVDSVLSLLFTLNIDISNLVLHWIWLLLSIRPLNIGISNLVQSTFVILLFLLFSHILYL